jgi:cellulose biosynthesis protein BcsQ
VREQVQQHFGNQVFGIVVPRSVRLSEAPSYGKPINTYAPTSPGGLAYQVLAQELLSGDSQPSNVVSAQRPNQAERDDEGRKTNN